MSTPGFHCCKRSLATHLSLPFNSATTEEGKKQSPWASNEEVAPSMSRTRRREGNVRRGSGVHAPKVSRNPLKKGVSVAGFHFESYCHTMIRQKAITDC